MFFRRLDFGADAFSVPGLAALRHVLAQLFCVGYHAVLLKEKGREASASPSIVQYFAVRDKSHLRRRRRSITPGIAPISTVTSAEGAGVAATEGAKTSP